MSDLRSSSQFGEGQRLDKWLWYARLAKTRTLAAGLVLSGKIRVNRIKAVKPSQLVRPGDVITSSAVRRVRILEVVALGQRRGPATEAQTLYTELTPEQPDAMSPAGKTSNESVIIAGREPGTGRPTKRDRRLLDRLKDRHR